MRSFRNWLIVGLALLVFVLVSILAAQTVRIYASRRPLKPVMDALSQPFPAYKDAEIFDQGLSGLGGIRPDRDILDRECYTVTWQKQIQIDMTERPNVSPIVLCNYYRRHIESCGLGPYGSVSSKPRDTAPMADRKGGFSNGADGINGQRAVRQYATSRHGVITLECIIVDRDGDEIIRLDPGHRMSPETDATGLQGRRIARLDIELFEVGFTDSDGRWPPH